MTQIRRSLALSFAARGINAVTTFISVIVIARLLRPEEIGIFSVGAALVAFIQVFREFGTSGYIVQETDLTPARMASAFGVTLVVAWVLGAALFALSGPVAAAYDEPGLRVVLQILSLSFIFLPIGSPGLAMLRREMAFGTLLKVTTIGSVVGPVTTISLALTGLSYEAMAWGTVANSIVVAGLSLYYRPGEAWVLPRLTEWRRVCGFGGQWSVSNLLNQMQSSLNDMILAPLVGFAAVGYFTRANGLLNLYRKRVLVAIITVALPAYAKKSRDGDDMVDAHLTGVRYITAVAWPFFAFLVIMAWPTVRTLFGDQWDASVPVLRVLAAAASIGVLWSLSGQLLAAIGLVNLNLRATGLRAALRVSLLLLAAWTTRDLVMVALALLAADCLNLLIWGHYMRRGIGVGLSRTLAASGRSAVVTLCSLVPPAVVTAVLGWQPEHPALAFFTAGFGWAAGWVAGVFLAGHPLAAELRSLGGKAGDKLRGWLPGGTGGGRWGPREDP